MPVTVHIIRHGEGFHNVSDENKSMRDPSLTEEGERQCRHSRQTFPHGDKLVKLFASPLTRTLQTCILAFRTQDFIKAHDPARIVALSELQEVSTEPHDTGLLPDELNEKFGGVVDLTNLEDDWFNKNTNKSWEKQEQQLFERGRAARAAIFRAIQDLPEDAHIGVASHGTFLHFATNDFSGLEPGMTTAWDNAEWRSYQFDRQSPGSDDDFALKETKSSWARRHDTDDRLTTEEQAMRRSFLLSKMREDFHES